MRVTPPIDITELQLTSSSAAEPHDPAAYNAGTTYGFGAIVKVAADFKIYESLQVNNLGKTPKTSPLWWRIIGATEAAYNAGTTYAIGDTVSANHRVYESLTAGNLGNPLPVLPEKETTHWFDIGATNKYAGFDLSRNTQTVGASPQTFTVTPGQRINTIGLLGLVANQAVISATSVFGGGTVYGPVTIDLNTRQVLDGYDYAFEPFSTQPSIALFDIPPYSDIIVTVTLSSTSGNVKYGSAVFGTYVYLGNANYGALNSELNFSTVDRTIDGESILIPRRSVPQNKQDVTVPSHRANKVRSARTALNAKPALWTGIDDGTTEWFDALTILGVYTAFDITVDANDHGTIRLEIEEI